MILRRIVSLLLCCSLESAQAAYSANHFNKVKQRILGLLEKNQRVEARTVIENELLRNDLDYKNKINALKYNMLHDFLTLAAQDSFETAAPLILIDKKKSLNSLEQCLALEPENLQCLWLELKYLRRYNFGLFNNKAATYIDTVQDLKPSQLLKYSLLMTLGRAAEIPAKMKALTPTMTESDVLENIIQFELAISAGNYLRAKEIVNYLSRQYSDYPDVIFMSYQLSILWQEGVGLSESSLERQYEVYKKKCADLPASVARKYFFDISLCVRSL